MGEVKEIGKVYLFEVKLEECFGCEKLAAFHEHTSENDMINVVADILYRREHVDGDEWSPISDFDEAVSIASDVVNGKDYEVGDDVYTFLEVHLAFPFVVPVSEIHYCLMRRCEEDNFSKVLLVSDKFDLDFQLRIIEYLKKECDIEHDKAAEGLSQMLSEDFMSEFYFNGDSYYLEEVKK